MCGRCRHVFNAFETLKRVEDEGSGEMIDLSAFRQTASAAPPASLVSRVDAESMQVDVAPPVVEAFDSFDIAAQKLERAVTSRPESAFVTVSTTSGADWHEDSSARDSTATKSTSDHRDPVPTQAAVTVLDEFRVRSNDANPLIAGAVPQQRELSRIWSWLAVLALLALVLQATYFWRSAIAQRIPELRPPLVQACTYIGCTVPWGRDEAAIKIESSELIEPPGKPGRILLSATLANRGATRQDFPAIEVRLSDTTNTLLASRVLLPKEYLGRAPGADDSIAPGGELYVNLNLELTGDAGRKAPSGYGLRAFYP
jgi:hypothetical protein